MNYEKFKAVCKWLQDEKVDLNLNEDELKQEYSFFKRECTTINFEHSCEQLKDKETTDFENWLIKNGYEAIRLSKIKKGINWFDYKTVFEDYLKEKNNL